MPERRIPSYRLHKPTGQAVVRLDGKDHYLGRHGTTESRERYDRLIAEWLAGGRRVPGAAAATTVGQAVAAYWAYARTRYAGSQLARVRSALAEVRRLYGRSPAAEFRGRALKAVRASLVASGRLNRRQVNFQIGCVKAAWRWLLSEELAPADAVQSVLAVASLRRGEADCREHEPVQAVAEADVERTLPHLPAVLADAVRVQLASGMRPGEVLAVRGDEVERLSDDLWVWRPARHKTSYRGHVRQVLLGPRAIAVLLPRMAAGYLFPPSWRAARRPGARKGPGERYTVCSYAQALRKACDRAGVPRWHAHQLRHAAASRFAADHGIEVARILLGHRSLDVTTLYAHENLDRTADVVRRAG